MAQALTHGARRGASGDMIARIRKALADYRLYRTTYDELAGLSDRDLSDLGIHRASIRDIARAAVYGAPEAS